MCFETQSSWPPLSTLPWLLMVGMLNEENKVRLIARLCIICKLWIPFWWMICIDWRLASTTKCFVYRYLMAWRFITNTNTLLLCIFCLWTLLVSWFSLRQWNFFWVREDLMEYSVRPSARKNIDQFKGIYMPYNSFTVKPYIFWNQIILAISPDQTTQPLTPP